MADSADDAPTDRPLRRGWTTGACATAAAKAALGALTEGQFPDPVTITLPGGQMPAFALAHEATKFRVTRDFFAQHSVTELMEQSDYWLEMQGRLTEPMRYDAASDHYVPVSWDDAFALIGSHLRALESPHQAEFYTSGRTPNEAAFLYSIFVREYGTNNFPDCSNMCHEPTSRGLPPAIGADLSSQKAQFGRLGLALMRKA